MAVQGQGVMRAASRFQASPAKARAARWAGDRCRAGSKPRVEIARIKLEAMGVTIDTLTDEQLKYLSSWEEGT
jgi:hypothetical protein